MKKAIWLQLAAALLTILPLLFLNNADFAGNNDALFYTIILKLVARHMAQGDWWPQWLPEANGGLGSPATNFYSMLSYQLTALLGAPLAAFDPFGLKRLVLGMVCAQWLGGITAWAWISRRVAPRAALLASLLYTLFPYKYIYIYLHFNLTQLWALAFLPPLMMAAEDLAAGKRKGWVWYGMWTALLALTHPRTLVAFAAMPALYAVLFAQTHRSLIIARLCLAHILAGLLAAFYLMPALANLHLIRSDLASTGRYYYADNLSHEDVLFNFHYLIIIALMIGLNTRVALARRTARETIFWSVSIMTVAILCMRVSKPLWDMLPMLQFLQFPASRFNAPALVAATALAAFFIADCGKARMRGIYSPYTLIVVVALMTFCTFDHIYKRLYSKEMAGWPYIGDMQALNIIFPGEYLTQWQPVDGNTIQTVTTESQRPPVALVSGQGRATLQFGANKMTIDANIVSDAALLRLRQFYWPAWQAVPPVQTAPDAQGLLTLRLPHGAQRIALRPAPLPGQRVGDILSLAAWLGVGAFLFTGRQRAA